MFAEKLLACYLFIKFINLKGDCMRVIGIIALILVIIGALNWGMIGFFGVDVVSSIFGPATMLTRVVFALVGLAGLWSLSFFRHVCCCPKNKGK